MLRKNAPALLDLAWCETVTAGPQAPEHLRRLARGETLRRSGGLTGAALCGRDINMGWDIRQATADDLAPLRPSVREWRCQRCLTALSES